MAVGARRRRCTNLRGGATTDEFQQSGYHHVTLSIPNHSRDVPHLCYYPTSFLPGTNHDAPPLESMMAMTLQPLP